MKMRGNVKRNAAVLLAAVMALSQVGCGQTGDVEPIPPAPDPVVSTGPMIPDAEQKQEQEPVKEPEQPKLPECPIGTEDTCWVASEWYAEDGEGAEGPHTMQPDQWMVDLIVRADGTARFRDIHDGLFLMEDADLEMTWEETEDDTYLFYNQVYLSPVLQGSWDNGIFSLDYRGTHLTMRQTAMPVLAGELYHPAELAGTWIMVSGQTEGWEWEALPGQLESLVFRTESSAVMATLVADREHREYDGTLTETCYGQSLEILEQPLFDGCGNESWSVRLGGRSALDKNGLPVETEYYVTLLERDILLMQQYFQLDGYPAVSYQTFRRMPDRLSWWDVEEHELIDTHWVCTGYMDADGIEHTVPPGMNDFYLHLEEGGGCWVGWLSEDSQYYTDTDGVWMLGNGGVIQLRGEGHDSPEGYCPEFWYAGGVRGCVTETADGVLEGYEMLLYWDGGVIRLGFTGYG